MQGFVEESRGPVRLLVRSDLRDAVVAAGGLEGWSEEPSPAASGAGEVRRGRARLIRIPLPTGGAVLARPYRRGGLLGPLLGSLHVGEERPRHELELTRRAAAAGVPTIEAVGVVIRRVAPRLYRFWLLSIEVEGARDLLAVLGAGGEASERAATIAVAARAVRALHDAGIRHADLNLKNILIVDGEPRRALVIDLDRSVAREGALDERDRLENLLRLLRSLRKQGHLLGRALAGPRECVRFARAYFADDREGRRRAYGEAARAVERWRAREPFWRAAPAE